MPNVSVRAISSSEWSNSNSNIIHISDNQTISGSSYVTVDSISPTLTRSYSTILEDNAPKSVEMRFPDGTSYTFRTANGFKDFWETVQKYNELEKKNQTLQESLAKVAEVLIRECPQYEKWINENYKELYND